jgi:hypothetical protein
MYVLIALVVLLGGITLVDLVLTVGLVRRLRQVADGLGPARGPGPVAQTTGLQRGATAPDLGFPAAVGVPALVAFLSTDCSACSDYLPEVRAFAAHFPGIVLAVLSGRAPKYEKYRAALGDRVRIAEYSGRLSFDDDSLINGFGVRSWPSFFMVAADRTVAGTGYELLSAHAETALSPARS